MFFGMFSGSRQSTKDDFKDAEFHGDDFLEETDIEDRLDLQNALEAIAESEKLGEQPIPWESVVGELV